MVFWSGYRCVVGYGSWEFRQHLFFLEICMYLHYNMAGVVMTSDIPGYISWTLSSRDKFSISGSLITT
jgi:hypothetical protein